MLYKHVISLRNPKSNGLRTNLQFSKYLTTEGLRTIPPLIIKGAHFNPTATHLRSSSLPDFSSFSCSVFSAVHRLESQTGIGINYSILGCRYPSSELSYPRMSTEPFDL
ncbi:unnamed protein product [Prunus brigantina]